MTEWNYTTGYYYFTATGGTTNAGSSSAVFTGVSAPQIARSNQASQASLAQVSASSIPNNFARATITPEINLDLRMENQSLKDELRRLKEDLSLLRPKECKAEKPIRRLDI